MGRLLIILLCFEIYQVDCKVAAFDNGGDDFISQGLFREETSTNENEIGNQETYNETILSVKASGDVGKDIILPTSHAVVLGNSEDVISQCTNLTLQLSYEVYELYVKSTDCIILIAFRGARLLAKTILCFLNNPDEPNVCVSAVVSSVQDIYIYASPMIAELFDLSGLLITTYQAVDHICF